MSSTAWWCIFLADQCSFQYSRNWWFSELMLRDRKKKKTELQAVSCPSELIGNQEPQNDGYSSQVPAVNWKEMRTHVESPRWHSDADRLAPLRPTHLVYKVIGFVWWLLVLLRPRSICPAQYVHSRNTANIRLPTQRCGCKISAAGGAESSDRWTQTLLVVNMDHVCSLHALNEASQQNWEPLRGHAEHWDGDSNSCCMCKAPVPDHRLPLSVHHSDPPSGGLFLLFFSHIAHRLLSPFVLRCPSDTRQM